MAKKGSMILYDKQLDICEEHLTDSQFGRLVFALRKDDPPDFGDDKLLAMAFAFISLQKELDDEKYAKKCETNKKNGSKGGRPKKNRTVISENPKNTLGFLKNPNDNEKVNDNDKDKDKVNDKEDGFHDDHDDFSSFGTFQNVQLTETEYDALKKQYERTGDLIEKVSIWLRSAKNDVPDHYALCVKFATNDDWPKRRQIEPPEPIVITDPLDPEEQERMVAQMRKTVGGMFGSS